MTVAEVMEMIRQAKEYAKILEDKAEDATDEHEADLYGDIAMMLGDYIAMMKDLKIKTEG